MNIIGSYPLIVLDAEHDLELAYRVIMLNPLATAPWPLATDRG